MGVVIGYDGDQGSLEGRIEPLEAGNDGTGNEMSADYNVGPQLLHNILCMCIKYAVQGKCGKTIE